MTDAYFQTGDGSWFAPTEYARGPWQVDACHAGPPTALMVGALEALVPGQRLTRITVDIMRPIPMSGFRVAGSITKAGRSASLTEAELGDDDTIYARAHGLHLRTVDDLDVTTAGVDVPDLSAAIPGPFPIDRNMHDRISFLDSVECRYDPASPVAEGGATTMWMRTTVPLLAGESPSPFQRICPLADSVNGISYNNPLGKVRFVNPDLTVSLHRDPIGQWFCAQAVSHWLASGVGLADAALFDAEGPVGRATQNLLLSPAGDSSSLPQSGGDALRR
ncbi:MAG: thioesterase family protein [Acidimicrobiia bacterium]|nr:MAG: thioesterase family protein [Acidimicrobiia bacterium]